MTTGFRTFDTTVQKTNKLLKGIEEEMGWPEDRRTQSYTALRAVLHALRDRLPVGEAANLGAQLPMLVRGIYYEGWSPSDTPTDMDREAFLQRIREDFRYSIDVNIGTLVQVVVKHLSQYMAPGEEEKIRSNLPGDLASLFEVTA